MWSTRQYRAFSSVAAALKNVPMSRLEPDVSIQYEKLASKLEQVRKLRGKPMTLAEKVLFSHLDDPSIAKSIQRGVTYLKLRPGSFLLRKINIRHNVATNLRVF
jgi:aconitate hydratase